MLIDIGEVILAVSAGGAGQEMVDNGLRAGTDEHCSKLPNQGNKTPVEVPNDILGMHVLHRT
jgi:hypothetical protein